MIYGFELGREWKLSLAEIFSFFPQGEILFVSEKILVLSGENFGNIRKILNRCGGVIKAFEVEGRLSENIHQGTVLDEVFSLLTEHNNGKKIEYGVNFYGERIPKLGHFLQQLKTKFKNSQLSSRFLNQNFQNLSSAIVLGQKLCEKHTDINIVYSKSGTYIGRTIWVQNIEFYSQRDFGKKRDMQTGMLPPKLAQILLNLLTKKDHANIYDPFCGLGTILIESALVGNPCVYGSDINPKMIESTQQNLESIEKKYLTTNITALILQYDATCIDKSPILRNEKIDGIVTEGYLGEIFTHQNISLEKIENQRDFLHTLYSNFFASLQKIHFTGEIIVCFPFWEFKKKYYYFEQGYKLLEKYCSVQKLIPKNYFARETVAGSLLYKRSEQLVGREIFKLKLK